MNPPAKVIVGPHVYTVVVDRGAADAVSREEHKELLGCANHRKQTITICPDQVPGSMRDTVMHEILHCVACLVGLSSEWGEEIEEAAINRLTPAVLDLLRRNPRLVQYLVAKD